MKLGTYLLLAAVAIGCQNDSKKAASKKTAAAESSGIKGWESITKGAAVSEGLFPIFQNKKTGEQHIQIGKSQLDQDFLYFAYVDDAQRGTFRGRIANHKVIQFVKHFGNIEIVEDNYNYYYDPASELKKAAPQTVQRSVIASIPIAAQDKDETKFLIPLKDFILGEAFFALTPASNPKSDPKKTFKFGDLSKDKTRVFDSSNYPSNTHITVRYVYNNKNPLTPSHMSQTDKRQFNIKLRHIFTKAPGLGTYEPRLADHRVGFFQTYVDDQTDPRSVRPTRDYIKRWKLVKKDPKAAVSDPVEPIVWWIDRATPVALRPAIREGALYWNEAFEKAGFSNAIVVKQQPDDATWDAGDLDYNVLRWASSPEVYFGGYGPNYFDPRTGQVIAADIMLEWAFVRARSAQAEISGQVAGLDGHSCHIGHSVGQGLALASAISSFASDEELYASQAVQQAVRHLVAHEVGHTIGLMHNMRSSQTISTASIIDNSKTRLAHTVMDYLPINLQNNIPQDRQRFYEDRMGDYDLWAIEFGYHQAPEDPAEAKALREKILSRATEPNLAFGNDADDMRSSERGIDPRVNVGDMGDDSIAWARHRLGQLRTMLPDLKEKTLVAGASPLKFQSTMRLILGNFRSSFMIASKHVGGIYMSQQLPEDPKSYQPLTPVETEKQKEAIALIKDFYWSQENFGIPSEYWSKIIDQRRSFDFSRKSPAFDLAGYMRSVDAAVLGHLFHAKTLARMENTGLTHPDTYKIAPMFRDLSSAIVTSYPARSNPSSRRLSQVALVSHFSKLLKDSNAAIPATARFAAAQELESLQDYFKRASRASGIPLDLKTHYKGLSKEIQKTLKDLV